jgi:uncharacterized membrane protein YfcA
MKNFIYQLLNEKGTISALRFMSVLCVFIAGAIAFYGITHGSNLGDISVLCGTFLGTAFGAKVGQKFAEVKQTISIKRLDNKESDNG